MVDTPKVKNSKILEIFDTMDYGESYENTDKAAEWLKTVEIADKTDEIDNILKNCLKVKWIEKNANDRCKLLRRLASEIEKNANTIAQIEILSRGILAKDTKNNAIPILAEYFHYYSSFAVKHDKENPNWKPEGITVGVISDSNTLWSLGMVLAPALAAGYNVILHAGIKLSIVATFIFHLAKSIGIPEGVLTLIPSDDGEIQPYLSNDSVAVVAIFANLQNDSYRGVNKCNKKILNLSSHKTPMIVFDNADLDSATESVIDAAWGYQGMLPWSLNTILVQENIFEKFTSKLKNRLKSVRIGNGNDKSADISYPHDPQVFINLLKTIEKAYLQGVEVFKSEESSNSFVPTILIGAKVESNKVLKSEQENNAVTVLAFRSIDEAVNLANNSRQGLGASVWSENLGLINEVTRKLKVNNIWVNGHGLTSVNVPITPLKDSGVGYFGGEEGFYEYVQIQKSEVGTTPSTQLPVKGNESVASAITNAKKAQENWAKISYVDRVKIFHEIADICSRVAGNTCSAKLPNTFSESLIATIYGCITNTKKHLITSHSGYDITSVRCPRGVVVIETKENCDLQNAALFLTALFEGNSVIVFNNSGVIENFIKEIIKKLPSGVLNIFPYSLENVKTAASHKELNGYITKDMNVVFRSLTIAESKIFTAVTGDVDDIYRKVTVSRNVWSNIGQSSQCNL